jgi:hypothetical protein
MSKVRGISPQNVRRGKDSELARRWDGQRARVVVQRVNIRSRSACIRPGCRAAEKQNIGTSAISPRENLTRHAISVNSNGDEHEMRRNNVAAPTSTIKTQQPTDRTKSPNHLSNRLDTAELMGPVSMRTNAEMTLGRRKIRAPKRCNQILFFSFRFFLLRSVPFSFFLLLFQLVLFSSCGSDKPLETPCGVFHRVMVCSIV